MTNNITTKVPDVMLANVMSLVPKIDEVTEFIVRNKINLSLITETWLKESVPNSVIDIPGFTLLRRDRLSQIHGGVCAYIKETHYKYKRLDDLNCCDDHECLWIYLRPTRLPRAWANMYNYVGNIPSTWCRWSVIVGSSLLYAYSSRIKISKLWNHCDRRL